MALWPPGGSPESLARNRTPGKLRGQAGVEGPDGGSTRGLEGAVRDGAG